MATEEGKEEEEESGVRGYWAHSGKWIIWMDFKEEKEEEEES